MKREIEPAADRGFDKLVYELSPKRMTIGWRRKSPKCGNAKLRWRQANGKLMDLE